MESLFLHDKRKRDRRCVEKDAIIEGIIDVLPGLETRRAAKKFTAVLMPSMWGPETRLLHERGVPWANMLAIERHPGVWGTQLRRWKRELGPQPTPKPLPAHLAVDHVPFVGANLVYLDFYSQPDGNHLRAMAKLIRLGVVAAGKTTMLVTFGVNRGDTFSTRLNARIKAVEPGEAYVRAAVKLANVEGIAIRALSNHAYVSLGHTAHFTTTNVCF